MKLNKLFFINNHPLQGLFFKVSLILMYALGIYSCANPVMPEGGAKDTTPPKIDTLFSSKPFETNYTKKPIRFKFNEWVVLDNVQTQLVVSPPLSYPPKVTLKGKTVEFQFNEKETLQANTTYSIQFGNSIKDLTEGNTVSDMRYVFSTGNEIDKAEVYGYASDAYTKEVFKDLYILLYSNPDDSAFIKHKPDYFAKTTKEGSFSIQNVRPGTFRLYALIDQNYNYRYDLETESIGFADTLIQVTKDQAKSVGILQVSKESKPATVYAKKLNQPGLVSAYFTANPVNVKYRIEDKGQKYFVEREMDTLKVWYTMDSLIDWNIYFENGLKTDTVKVKPLKMPAGKGRRKFGPKQGRFLTLNNITSSDAFTIDFTNPIVSHDSTKVLLSIDSTENIIHPILRTDPEHPGKLSVLSKWQEGRTYNLVLLPGALKDFFGNTNDTMRLKAKVLSSKELGNISIHVTKLDPGKQYVLELYNLAKKLVSSFVINGQSKWDKRLPNLIPGQYEILIIEDLNKNGVWDPIDLKMKKQAEPVYRRKTDPLRANWELDVNLAL